LKTKDRAKLNAQGATETILVPTKFGVFALELSGQGLCGVRFPGKNSLDTHGVRLNTHRVCEKAVKVFRNYFKDPAQKLNLKLDFCGFTPFEKKVYQTLLRVPAGRVISYGELAKRAGYPGAARAVGTAMKKNRLPIAVACHRVIRSDGSLGQYSSGIQWKRCLLKHEEFSAQRATVNAQRRRFKTLRFAR
jgi:O-6-methylguanine DNA methyltransferase